MGDECGLASQVIWKHMCNGTWKSTANADTNKMATTDPPIPSIFTTDTPDFPNITLNDTVIDHHVSVTFNVESYRMKIIFSLIGCVGIIGNLLIIALISYNKHLRRSTTNLYILNQSCIDLVAALAIIFNRALFDSSDGRYFHSFWDRIYCNIWLTQVPVWGSLMSSTYNLVAMTFDRYLAIVHPIYHRTHYGRPQVYASMVSVWVLGFVVNVLFNLSCGIQDGQCLLFAFWPSLTVQKFSSGLLIVVQFFLPIAVHAFCYIRMALAMSHTRVAPLQRNKPPDDEGGQPPAPPTLPNTNTNTNADKKLRAKKNIFKILVLVVMCFFLCWVWNQCLFFAFHLFDIRIDFHGVFYHFTVVAVFCNCCINPPIYLLRHEQFKAAVRATLRRATVAPTSESAPTDIQ